MQRDINSLISVSLAAMDQPSTPVFVSLHASIDDGISDDAEDDSIPFTKGIPSKEKKMSEATT